MKISDITRRSDFSGKSESAQQQHPFGITMTLIDQWRITYDDIRQNSIAELLTLLYSPGAWYVSLASSVGHVTNAFPFDVPYRKSNTQMDDLLFSGGYSFTLQNHTKITLTGQVGVPVHQDVSLIGAQFGTGHVGFGPQIDIAYAYDNNRSKNHLLIASGRYLRFLSRTARACLPDTPEFFKVTLGNVIDLLFATNQTFGNHNWELGYNGTFAFGAAVEPPLIELTDDQSDFLRSSFYTTYAYSFSSPHVKHGILFGFSYGSDYRPLPLVYRRLFAGWFSWNISF